MKYFYVNSLIKDRNGRELAKIFDLNMNLVELKAKKVCGPFGDVLKKQKRLLIEKTYENAEDVVQASFSLLEEGSFVYPVVKTIINNCLMALNHWGGEKNKESLAKILINFTKTSGENETKFYIFNVLFQLYFEINKFGLLENLILISENNRRGKKDFYIYNFYKGLVLFYLDRFAESFEALRIAFRSKKLKSVSAIPFFLCAILNGKFPKESALVKYNCECLINLSQSVKYGIYNQTTLDVENISNFLIKNHLFRPCYTFLPLISFCNLIKRLYYLFSTDAKLEIERIREATEMDHLEIFSLLTSAIDIDMIKGYLSVNKGVVVFSKVNPFPNEINL
ncbi:PCI domain-containing protein 2 [Nosema granulosis]|uniref:PCI domain-containing protein 2 n=1 Tax=Nosema granulosis TaxID=83296 RepID=A0A9P6GYH6_9MICR|nr:PCI domain-containing protein 2 [Nosema granulosis]